jgi:hypothetical protein
MSAETEWVPIACAVADVIRHSEHTTPIASKTDLGGTYGKAEIYTEWGLKDGDVPVLREWRFPDERAVDHPEERLPDVEPCRHEVPTRGGDS